MPEMSTAKFHSDHLAWKQDIEMWRQDAASWRKEQLRVLNDVKLALFTEQSLIQQHLDAVERHQHLIDAHERLLVLCETPPVRQHNEMEARIAVTHEEHAVGQHENLRGAHESLKHHHFHAMASLATTLREIARQSEPGHDIAPVGH